MTQAQIISFVAVCRTGSITKAGRSMGVTPQAVAKAIKQLEVELGGELLERSTDGSRPTELGREVYKVGERMLQFDRQSLEEMKNLSKRAARQREVNLGIINNFLQVMPADIITDFTQLHPEIKLNVRAYFSGEEYEQDVIANRIELGFCFFPNVAERMESLYDFETHLYVIVGNHHRLAGRGKIEPEDLRGEDLIVETSFGSTDLDLGVWAEAHGLTPRIFLPPFNDATKRAMVLRGNYVAFSACPKAWLPYGITALELAGERERWVNSFSKLKGRPLSEAAQIYCDYILPRFLIEIGPSGER